MGALERKQMRSMDRILAAGDQGIVKKQLVQNRALRRILNNKLSVLGIVLFLVITITAFLSPFLAPYVPTKIDMGAVLNSPSWEHWFGTDKLGRDVFSRVLYGGRVSIAIGLGSALGAGIIGTFFGIYGGYVGGWFDRIAMRVSELFMAFPQIIIVLLLVSIVGQSTANLVIIFVLTGWAPIYRMARSRALSIREEEYVVALRAFGVSRFVISFKEILPNAIGPIAVNITLSTAMFILQEASLSFLGLGVPLETATWGNILNVANDLTILKDAWWMWVPVGLMISLFVLSVNFIGDGLRDAFDPRQQID